MIDEAALGGADLVVLPEFSNHLSWYDDKEHCFRVSVPIGGPFLSAIGARAARHAMHVVVNCTVQRSGFATCTSLLFGPDGALPAARDKQVLMGHENDFLEPASDPGPVVTTALGRLGLYACMDGVICEPARSLALRGAQILCNSLNSFAPDEAALHIPVRAAENRVFVVAANKVGPLIPAPSRVFDGQITALIVVRASSDGALTATIHPANAHNKVVSRRTHLLDNRPWNLARALVRTCEPSRPSHQERSPS